MKKLYVPNSESELAVIRSLLDSADIPYYIRNEYFGSLYIGPIIGGLNNKPIFVHENYYKEAKDILARLIEEDCASLQNTEEPTFFNRVYKFFRSLLR